MLDVEVQEFLRDDISRIFRVDVASLSSSTDVPALPGFDSVRIYELVLDCEKRFGIAIPEEEAMDVRTLGELAALISDIRSRATESAP